MLTWKSSIHQWNRTITMDAHVMLRGEGVSSASLWIPDKEMVRTYAAYVEAGFQDISSNAKGGITIDAIKRIQGRAIAGTCGYGNETLISNKTGHSNTYELAGGWRLQFNDASGPASETPWVQTGSPA